jgi:hypothetical protein
MLLKKGRRSNAKKHWQPNEILFLKQNANTMKDEDIATRLGRTTKSIREKRQRLELIKGNGRGRITVVSNRGIKVNRPSAAEPENTNESV